MSFLNWIADNALSLLGVGTSAYSANRTIASNERMQERQLNHADAAATTAYIRQNEMMDKMNLYNSPVKQMERYAAAGLNPYLLYGQGGGTISAATANVQQANTPSVSYAPNYYEGVASSLQNFSNNYFQMKRLENESKVADAQARSLLAKAGLDETQNKYDLETFSARKEALELSNMVSRATKNKIDADTLLSQAETELSKWRAENTQASTSEINARRDYVMMQTAAQQVLNKWLDKRQAAELASIVAQARMYASQGRLADARVQIERFNAETYRQMYNLGRERFNYERYVKDAHDRDMDISGHILNERREQHDYELRSSYNSKDFGNDMMDIVKMAVGGMFDYEGSLNTHEQNIERDEIRHSHRMEEVRYKNKLRKK